MTDWRFPTRRYPYRRNRGCGATAFEAGEALEEGVRSFVLGIDPEPFGRLLTREELQSLGDPFARQVLSVSMPPLSLDGVLAAIDAAAPDAALPEQQQFVVAEGGQIPWSEETAFLDRGLRVVVVRARNGDARLLASTTYPFDSEDDAVFLQVAGWDDAKGVFNFYERRGRRWIWAGNSWHALTEPTRGRGPFDSHVNGALVMKELRIPWPHWHSMNQSIILDVFGPGHPVRSSPLLRSLSGAEMLERGVIVPAVERWTRRRLDATMADPREVRNVDQLMRQVLIATSVNIYASPELSATKRDDDRMTIPLDFLLDREGLLGELDVVPDSGVITMPVGLYRAALARYSVVLRDESQDFSQTGDLPFPFACPGRAFEDTIVVRELVSRQLISRRFAAALLMVDFSNPIGSTDRADLMRWVPETVIRDERSTYPIETAMRSAIEAAAVRASPDSALHRVLADLERADWHAVFSQRLTDYLRSVQARFNTEEGADDYFRLLEFRRRLFRKRPIAEFGLSLPHSSIQESQSDLMMLPDATVVARSSFLGG